MRLERLVQALGKGLAERVRFYGKLYIKKFDQDFTVTKPAFNMDLHGITPPAAAAGASDEQPQQQRESTPMHSVRTAWLNGTARLETPPLQSMASLRHPSKLSQG